VIERWRWDEREHIEQFKGEPFVSVDPGSEGYALGWAPDSPIPVGYCHSYAVESLVELFARTEARVMIVEAQYVRNLSRQVAILELNLRIGMAIGWLACSLRNSATWGFTLNLFQLAPATWQAHQRRLVGWKGKGQPKREEGIQISLARAETLIGDQEEWKKATKPRKEGLASALGIGEWWKGQIS
jgi:hypothetical protein